MINHSEIGRLAFGFLNLLVISFYLLSPGLPYIEYMLRRKYIEKNLCVEKDKAENTCHGKCYLHPRLQKSPRSSDTENEDKGNLVPDRKVDDNLKGSASMQDLFRHDTIIINNGLSGLTVSYIPEIFRPPEA